MAIVKCPNCGKMVSDTSKRCSQCDGDLVVTKYACGSCSSLNVELDPKGYKTRNSRTGLLWYFFGPVFSHLLSKTISKKEYKEIVAKGGGYYVCKDCKAVTWISPDDKK